MWIWVVTIVSGICSSLSFSMGLCALGSGGSGAFLFAGFGLFFGALFIVSTRRILAERGSYIRGPKDTILNNQKPVSFVPHWFMMLALTVTVIAVLAAILIPIFSR